MGCLVYVVSEDGYFLSHRLPMASAAVAAGFRVVVAVRDTGRIGEISALGFEVVPITLSRGGLGPLGNLRSLWELVRLYRRLRPDVVHHVALKPVFLGSLAAVLAGRRRPAVVNALAGMGYLFISRGMKARLLRAGVVPLLGWLLNRPRGRVLVQNADDARFMVEGFGVAPARVVVIPGSGVDTEALVPSDEPAGPVVFALVARMLWDKGVGEFVEAARLLKARGLAVRCRLVGGLDAHNPAAIDRATLDGWVAEGAIEWAGASDDIPGVWRASHVAVLPSYREGMPKALLEAAACGRPLIATDVPGCRALVEDGVNGLLVPARDGAALAQAMARLAGDGDLRRRLGARARADAEATYSAGAVAAATGDLYRRLGAD
ncbi:glycosyltransferase family 4 protein [Roseospirillum parvum]|uniref:Glycosyltransferase involved in cell wall bisynthesis n=1 Tax=Roseospirillum parvum TaxID=83401 RepID=A0A1G8EJC6_9PROT|nr:glycosyltransferase family 4 protein [Roseospirillum parvum]SDH69971.1 Glycosyltransferase involved in cell wall bisynthesis [Roseospirillum parvum]